MAKYMIYLEKLLREIKLNGESILIIKLNMTCYSIDFKQ